MLAENRTVSAQYSENRATLLAKEVECDQKEVTIALQKQEIETLKLSITDLQAYKSRYETQAQEQIRTKETQVEELHGELEALAVANHEFSKQVNMEKDLLIASNNELKKALSETKLELEMAKSEVETQHGQMQVLNAELEAEKR